MTSGIKKALKYVFIVMSAAVLIVAAFRFWDKYTERKWEKVTERLAAEKLKGEVNRIQKFILSIEQIPKNLGYVLEFSRVQKDHMKLLLNAIVQNNEEVFGVSIAFEPNTFYKDSVYYAPYAYKRDGKLNYANPTDSNYHYFSMDWYLIPKRLNRAVWIEPYFDEGSGGGNIVMSTYSVPFFRFDGQKETMRGIISVDISLEWLAKMVTSVKLTPGSYALLISENGNLVCSPGGSISYNESIFSIAEEEHLPVLREIGRDLQKKNSGFMKVGTIRGVPDCWIAYRPIPANNWGLLLVIPERK